MSPNDLKGIDKNCPRVNDYSKFTDRNYDLVLRIDQRAINCSGDSNNWGDNELNREFDG